MLVKSKPTSLLIMHLIILNCGDIEQNPGPISSLSDPKYPFTICSEEVNWNNDAMQCDRCGCWLHRSCLKVTTCEYNRLENSSTCWICGECGLRNISTSLFLKQPFSSTRKHGLNFNCQSMRAKKESFHNMENNLLTVKHSLLITK